MQNTAVTATRMLTTIHFFLNQSYPGIRVTTFGLDRKIYAYYATADYQKITFKCSLQIQLVRSQVMPKLPRQVVYREQRG